MKFILLAPGPVLVLGAHNQTLIWITRSKCRESGCLAKMYDVIVTAQKLTVGPAKVQQTRINTPRLVTNGIYTLKSHYNIVDNSSLSLTGQSGHLSRTKLTSIVVARGISLLR